MAACELGDLSMTDSIRPKATRKEEARQRVLRSLESGEYRTETTDACRCGSHQCVCVAKEDRSGLPFGILLCNACGLLRTNPRLCNEVLPLFYERDYHELIWGDAFSVEINLVDAKQGDVVYGMVKDHLPSGKRSLRVLEIGCSNGGVLHRFAECAGEDGVKTELFGSEYNSELCAEAKKRGVTTFGGGISEIADTLAGMDVLILSHVLEHVIDLDTFLVAMHKMLEDGGVAYIEVPGVLAQHRDRWKAAYGLSFRKYFTFAHMWHFSLHTLRDAVGEKNWSFLDGDEHIHAVFRKGGKSRQERPPSPSQVREVKRYLKWLSIRYDLQQIDKNHPSFGKKLVAKFLYRLGLYHRLVR